jgi:hypothetical protein
LTGGGNLWNLLCKYRKGKGEWVGREGNGTRCRGHRSERRRPGKHDPVRPGETNQKKKGLRGKGRKIPKIVKMACRCQPCGKKKKNEKKNKEKNI